MQIQERESQENIRRMAPHVSRANDLSKAGQVDEAFTSLRPYLERDEVPSYLYMPVGWVIYRYIKENTARLLPHEATKIFGFYLRLCQSKPEMVHSYVMVKAIDYNKKHPEEFDFTAFCRKWRLDNFRDEDYVGGEGVGSDGKNVKYQSLVVKAATALYKCLKRNHTEDTAREFLPFFETLSQRCPDYEFTPLYIANMHAWMGEKDEAVRQFRHMLTRNQQWYLWSQLGNLLDTPLRLSCYCKALSMSAKEEFNGDLHLGLATMLATSSPQQAAYELSAYATTCKNNGWRIKAQAYELEQTLHGVGPASDGPGFYLSHSAGAEDFVYDGLPCDEFVYKGTSTNAKGKQHAVLSCRKRHVTVHAPLSPQLRKASVGDVFLCHYCQTDSRAVLLSTRPTGKHIVINPPPAKAHDNNREQKDVEGTVRTRPGQEFAFVDDCFIPPRLRQSAGLVNGQHIKAKARRTEDGRWRVVKVY